MLFQQALINLQGVIVDYGKMEHTASSFTMPLKNNLTSGIYIMRVTTDQGIYKKELIIKK